MEWQCDTLSDASYFICQHNLNAKRFLKFDMHQARDMGLFAQVSISHYSYKAWSRVKVSLWN